MAKNGTYNGQKRVEAEQSSYYREYPVAFGQKREIVGVGQSDTANNTLCRYCFQGTSVFGQKAPGAPVFGHCLNVSVQYKGGLLLDNILLTQCYYHRGTRLNAMKRFCFCSL